MHMRTYFLVVLLLLLMLPVGAQAALININTADAVLLETLPGIGPAKAAAIIDYRTQHGSFAKKEDIQNVSGIGPSTYAALEAFITVGDTDTPEPADSETEAAATSTESGAAATKKSGTSSSKTPPVALTVEIAADPNAFIAVPLELSASAKTKNGIIDPAARVSWSFGDGSSGRGIKTTKTYRYAGTYLIVAEAVDGPTTGRDELVVTVRPAQVQIRSVTSEGILVANESNERLDLSGWALFASPGSFRVPRGTMLLPNTDVLFPSTVTKLSMTSTAILAYPGGGIAAQYPALQASASVSSSEHAAQPSSAVSSSYIKQTVDPRAARNQGNGQSVGSAINITRQAYVEEVSAPSATSELAALGAVTSPVSEEPALVAPPARDTSGIFRSPWVMGFLGVIALAGGALLVL